MATQCIDLSDSVAALVFGEHAAENHKLIPVPEIAKALDVSPRVVCRLVDSGELRGVRLSQRDIRVSLCSIREFIRSGGVQRRGTRKTA